MGRKGANLSTSKQVDDTYHDEPDWLRAELDRVFEHRLAHLSLWRREINSLPDRVREMTWLETITLSGTSIGILPEWLAEMPLLRWVDAMRTPLVDVPTNVKVALDWSVIQANPALVGSTAVVGVRLDQSIDRLPAALYEFKHLTILDLGCYARVTPNWGRTSDLERRAPAKTLKMIVDAANRFEGLKQLDVFDCRLKSLPTHLCNFQDLEVLGLSENPLRELPAWLPKLKELRSLFAASIKLSKLPSWICDFKQLRVLDPVVFTDVD